ncbi:hypothetical protein LUZ63_023176 [Rhynchospora breviuscula]|uniref:S-adenosylmethionine synthase n=1 Tax=Rhynchospora breviuscula TaxID=2022672 RepID=A0A9P9Z434_9POAL|nr:hypothetical protein LUZ63_023176 [Rhynchospora breviuscula]
MPRAAVRRPGILVPVPSPKPTGSRLDRPAPVHVRVRHGRTPRQDLRPDLRQHPGCHPHRGSVRPRRRRDPRDHGAGARRGRGVDERVRRDPRDRARRREPHRVHLQRHRLRRRLLRRERVHRSAVLRHRRRRQQGVRAARARLRRPARSAGRGGPGHHVRLRDERDPQLMPMAAWTAHRIAERLASVRKSGALPFLRPDGKTQVTLGYDGHTPRTVDSVVLSTQHHPDISQEELRALVQAEVIDPVLRETGLDLPDVQYYINPAGPFVIGGPKGDAGLTGRKIIIDTYGGASRHGGGAFSGKDPSKVDRSAAYAMRWVAKNAVAAGFADRLEVQVAYAIGKANPVGLYVESFGTAHVADDAIVGAIREVFDLRPKAIIDQLDLLRPIYAQTAAYGHFGRELPEFTWERTDRVDELRAAAGL